jgi:mannose-1-phosphate guanylyltransferase
MMTDGLRSSFSTVSPRWAVVLAGGAGRRLERLTRTRTGQSTPKQFCRFGHRESLLQRSLRRIAPIFPSERMLVVINEKYRTLATTQVASVPEATLLEQPGDRGTAIGVLLPVAILARQNANATVVVLPSDHGIGDEALFVKGIEKAMTAVEGAPGLIVVGGVKATAPVEDYGWIVPEVSFDSTEELPLRRVRRFVEKPGPPEARALYREGAAWSTFVLVAKSNTLRELLAAHLGREIVGLFDRSADLEAPQRKTYLTDHYARLPRFDFSSNVLCRARNLAVLVWPEALGWTDLGTPTRLTRWLESPAGAV